MRAIPLFLLLAACVCTPAAALHSPRDLLSAFFRFLDVDGDNAVTHDEVHQRVLSTGSAHHPPAAPGEHLAHNVSRTFTEHLSRWDRDGDGSVSLPELFDRAALGSAAKTMRASGFGSWLGLSNMFDPHYPAQVHLALAGASTNMTVMWLTRSPYAEAPLVEYWQLSGGPVLRAVGSSATYGVPKRWWGGFHGWVHTAVMEGLAPGREHGYRVGGVPADGGELVWGAVHPFRAPRPPASDALTRLVTFGDMGTVMPLGLAVCEQIILDYARAGANWDGVMHVGDLAYAGIATNIPLLNITSGDEWEPIWDLWGAQIEPLASRMPYMTGVGNHESFYNYVAFRHRFRMPGPESGGEGNFWFSFDMGNVHVTSLSTEHDYSPGSAQLRWLEQDLARAVANRARVPWLVVTGHRPMYCSDQVRAQPHARITRALRALAHESCRALPPLCRTRRTSICPVRRRAARWVA